MVQTFTRGRIALLLRLIAVAICALPLIGMRNLVTSPLSSVRAPIAPMPVSEEEETERAVDVQSRPGRADWRPQSFRIAVVRPSRACPIRSVSTTHALFRADPLCNGLGTPYRC